MRGLEWELDNQYMAIYPEGKRFRALIGSIGSKEFVKPYIRLFGHPGIKYRIIPVMVEIKERNEDDVANELLKALLKEEK